MLHCTGELTQILLECTNAALDSLGRADAYIKRTRFVDYALTPEDAARGPSNIRKQKASKTSVKEATAFAAMADLFAEAGIDIKTIQMANTPGTGAWKAKFAAKQEAKEAEMLEDIANLAGTNWDLGLLEENEETEDNAVEMRRIAVSPLFESVTPVEITVIENRAHLEAVFSSYTGKAAIAAQDRPENPVTMAYKEPQPPKKLTALEMLRAKKVQS